MSTTRQDEHERVALLLDEAAAWASQQPWPLTAEQVRTSTQTDPGRRTRPDRHRRVRRRRHRAALAVLTAGLAAAAATAIIVATSSGAGTQLRLSSYSLRLPSGFRSTPYQRTVCMLTAPLLYPTAPTAATSSAGLSGSRPPVVAADTKNDECVQMAFIAPAHGEMPTPVRIIASDRPVVVDGHHGLIGSTVVRGIYRIETGGRGTEEYVIGQNGGLLGPMPNGRSFHEVLVVLALAVPVAGHERTLEIVEHGFSQNRFLEIVSSGLAADVARSPTARYSQN